MCGYDTTWLQDLVLNTSGYTPPIKPESKHMVVTAYTRGKYTPPITRTRNDMKLIIASFGNIIYTNELYLNSRKLMIHNFVMHDIT